MIRLLLIVMDAFIFCELLLVIGRVVIGRVVIG